MFHSVNTINYNQDGNPPLSMFNVNDEEEDTKHDAEGTSDDVGDAQEIVLASEPRGRRQDDALSATKLMDGISW